MERRTVETVGFEAEAPPMYSGIRWSAVFAGLVVGLGIHLLLMLIGFAAGFAVFGAGARPDGGSVSIAAALWNTVSMLVAALTGGYVAARGSALRRSLDGMLHGAVSWGAAILFFAILTGAFTGNAIIGAFSIAGTSTDVALAGADQATLSEFFAALKRGDRPAATSLLRDRLGLSEEQAGRAADQTLAMTGQDGTVAQNDGVSGAAQTASVASAWLSVAILLSLLASVGGGLLGARGVRQRAIPGHYRAQRIMQSRLMHRVSTPLG